MHKLSLPDVTLVMIETREHALARMAVEDSIAKVDFGEVLILTDRPEEFASLSHVCDTRIHLVPDWPDKLGWARASWYEMPPLVRTPFILQTQWDSSVWDTAMWTDEFFDHDYIGSPWWYSDGLNVGNSGFSLVSTSLKRFIRDHAWDYPCNTALEDDLLCRKYRQSLTERGFTWSPEKLAHQFAFECCRPSKTSRHFGYHGCFNFPAVLDYDRLLERMRLVFASPYIAKPDSYILKAFCQNNPEIARRVMCDLDENVASLVAAE